MTCQELIDFLMAYLEKDLPAAEQAEFERHLKICPSCVAYIDGYRKAISMGKAACAAEDRETQAPPELIAAILAARRAGQSQNRPYQTGQ